MSVALISEISLAWQPDCVLSLVSNFAPYISPHWTTGFMLGLIPTFLIPYLSKNKIDYSTTNSWLSFANATLSATFGLYSLYQDPIFSPLGWTAGFDPLRALLVDLFAGFYVFDLLWSIYAKEYPIILHHGLCMGGIAASRAGDVASKGLIAGMAIAEISTPFMHLRRFAIDNAVRDRDSGKVKHVENKKSGYFSNWSLIDTYSLFFTTSFLICRGIFTPYIVYKLWMTEGTPSLVLYPALITQLLSFGWAPKVWKILMGIGKGNAKDLQPHVKKTVKKND